MSDSTVRFANRADDYAKYRPTYPSGVVAAVLDGFTRPQVADLGAGTGISAALLADAGALVYAVEPNAQMRAALPERGEIVAVSGTAESTGLEPLSVDVITAFQAYHWFDPQGVFAESDRIARKRARFAAVWNERDERDAFTRAYSETIRPFMTDDTEQRRRGSGIDAEIERYGWGPAKRFEFTQEQALTWEALLGRARSASYLPREGSAYEAMTQSLRTIFDAAAAGGTVRFALMTTVHIGERS